MSKTSNTPNGAEGVWGTTTSIPPGSYWRGLEPEWSGPQLKALKKQSDLRQSEFTPELLPPPEIDALGLLERVAADGWLESEIRSRCPSCDFELDETHRAGDICPECTEAFSQHGGVTEERIFTRDLAQSRDVDWVVAVHGMNTSGAWQEEFSWLIATTWGRSVPVAVYKYGHIIVGVIMAGRRRLLQNRLREKIAALKSQAEKQGYSGKPDLIAHSFGTWLIGHLLEDERQRAESDRLQFGRVILTGCVLRPDFDWGSIKEAGLVEDVLNHYGTTDPVVPLAHFTIWDSGPSGRRGFDGNEVTNIRAEGYGHSDLFSIEKRLEVAESGEDQGIHRKGLTLMENAYRRCWRPFLTVPGSELAKLPDQAAPEKPWRPYPWPLRGTIFPFLALPLVLALAVLLLISVGSLLGFGWSAAVRGVQMLGIGLGVLLGATAIVAIWRSLWS